LSLASHVTVAPSQTKLALSMVSQFCQNRFWFYVDKGQQFLKTETILKPVSIIKLDPI